ncbi:uncharacterized protein LOC124149185 isoform X2 [Haliotis rufescens]|uniref:uncharacterized protein LOC124149185 isoform X2 n=1 Tax=Haliotis rufescens TaxID=6454 RepID=UPI00201EA8E6|nr:uncharacterized protein LOC124149185 isoform X2 [Haliotis rufescens]
MEKQYSVEFFASFVEQLQDVCRNYLHFSQFVEVSGYVCVEIDNMKKERYVLSELLQSSGNVVSESYCTKAFETSGRSKPVAQYAHMDSDRDREQINKENMLRRNHRKRPCPNPVLYSSRDTLDSGQYTHSPILGEEEASNDAFSQPVEVKFQKTQNVGLVRQFNITKPATQPLPTSIHHDPIYPTSCEGPSAERTDDFENCYQPTISTSTSPFVCGTSTESGPAAENHCLGPDFMAKPAAADKTVENKEVLVTIPQRTSEETHPESVVSVTEADEVIDLDLFEDDLELDEESCQAAPGIASVHTAGIVPNRRLHLSPGTQVLVRNSVNQFKRFLYEKYQEDIDLVLCPPEKLNMLLLDYLREARKVDGGELKGRSLKCVQERLDIFLKDAGYPYSITKDKEFQLSRDYLKRKIIEDGKNVSQKHSPVDSNDIELLFQTCQLGGHSLETLINSMWFLNSKFFGLRGPAYHVDLKWGNIVLRTNPEGQEYLERKLNDAFSLKVYAKPDDPSRCFVNMYKQYRYLRPKIALDEGYSFYLKHSRATGQDSRYLPEPMVYHQFTNIWRKIVVASGLPLKKKIM